MPGFNTTRLPAENIGLALLRAAALEDDAFNEDCCEMCHSANVAPVDSAIAGDDWECRNCGARGIGLEEASHLADALKNFDEPLRKIEHHELAALVERAAFLEVRVAELNQTIADERAAVHSLAERVRAASTTRRAA